MVDMVTAYHIVNGPANMYAADAAYAVREHSGEWSREPWTIEETNAFRRREHDRLAAEAKAAGREPPPEPVELTIAEGDQAEIDEFDRAYDEAVELVRADDERIAEEAEYARRVAAARQLLATKRPSPTPVPVDQVRNPRDQVPIDDNWQTLSGPKKRSLAVRLGASNKVTEKEAETRIAEELDRRKAGIAAKPGADNPSGSAPTTPLPETAPNTPPNSPGPAPTPIADPYAHQPDARPSPDPQAPQPVQQSQPRPIPTEPQPQPQPSATFEQPAPALKK